MQRFQLPGHLLLSALARRAQPGGGGDIGFRQLCEWAEDRLVLESQPTGLYCTPLSKY